MFNSTNDLWNLAKDVYNENRCCTVIALAVVTGKPLKDCFKMMQLFGRKKRRGMFRKDWIKALNAMKTFNACHYADYSKNNRITVKKFLDTYPKGTYYVASRGHAFAIIDGVIHDYKEGLRRQITSVYKITFIGE